MAQPTTRPATLDEIHEALKKHGTKAAAARALGIPRETLRNAILRSEKRAFDIRKQTVTLDREGEVERRTLVLGAAQELSPEILPGHVVKGESILLDAEGKVLQKWIKTREDHNDKLVDALTSAFTDYRAPHDPGSTHSFAGAGTREAEADTLTVYPLPDLHFGMHAWKRDSGDNYDIKIARDLAQATLSDLVQQSRPSKRAVLLGLGDYFHQNDQKNVTPRSGHRLDVDGRWSKVYAAGASLMLDMIELLASKHEQVEVVMLPGNHDEDAAVTLRVALSLFYRDSTRIRVYDEPGLAWYCRFGKVLLGAHHGHTMKPRDMAMMLAADRPQDWGETQYRSFYSGHIHHETAQEVGPVRVESFQTPAARDAYAQEHGYRSGRSLQAITFHAQRGEIGRHRVNIHPPLDQANNLQELVA